MNVTGRKPSASQQPSANQPSANQPVANPELASPLNEKHIAGFANGRPVLDEKRLFTYTFRPGQRMSFFQPCVVLKNMASIKKNISFKEMFSVPQSQSVAVRNFVENGNDLYTCPSKPP